MRFLQAFENPKLRLPQFSFTALRACGFGLAGSKANCFQTFRKQNTMFWNQNTMKLARSFLGDAFDPISKKATIRKA